jgi:predicted SprT family Zn-dependent metalloprotease
MATDVQQQVNNKINECLKRGRQLFKAKVILDHIIPSDSFTKSSGSAGWNKQLGWYIKLSKKDLTHHLDYMLNEIIPHEVAHVICMWLHVNHMPMGDDGHGEAWTKVAKALGSSGEAKPLAPQFKHSYKTSKGNMVKVNDEQHEDMQKRYKRYTAKDGGVITAAGYQGK